jgi:hypothetical protein
MNTSELPPSREFLKTTEISWYESNSCWGAINSIKDLVEMANKWISVRKGRTVELFLQSRNSIRTDSNFGMRNEHCGPVTLKQRLDEMGFLDDFLKNFSVE